MSCPVCYESFSEAGSRNAGKKLNCGCSLCARCVSDEFIDGVFFCPECGSEHHGENIDDFSRNYEAGDEATDVGDEESSTVEDMDRDYDRENKRHSSPAILGRSYKTDERMPCKFPNCKNKAASNFDVCLIHAKNRRHSVLQVENITRSLEKDKLSIMTMSTSGDKLHKMDSKSMKQLSPEELMQRFKGQERIEFGQAIQIIEDAKSVMIREPNILRLDAPVVAVGDVHGQFYDLLSLLEEGGKPGVDETYLFLGDYVDRGSFSCEVMLFLLLLKVTYPDRVFLLRGNHECGSVSGHFGFKDECKTKYGVNVYYKFLLCFQTMPLAAVISTAYGDIFACHGGISPSLKTLDDIDRIDRFVEPESDPLLLDLLWADPVSDENVMEMNDDDYQSFMEVDWCSNPARGCSYCFGYKALRQFLDDNKLVCLVRAHEVQKNGFKKHFDPIVLEARMRDILQRRSASLAVPTTSFSTISSTDNNFDLPPLITIFSAPNYCDRYENKAAILRIDMALDDFRIIQYDSVEHPVPEIHESETDNHVLTIIATCPYIPSSFKELVRMAVELGPEKDLVLEEDDDEEEAPTNAESIEKSAKSSESTKETDMKVNPTISETETMTPFSPSNSTKASYTSSLSPSTLETSSSASAASSSVISSGESERSSAVFSPSNSEKVLSTPRRRESRSISMSQLRELNIYGDINLSDNASTLSTLSSSPSGAGTILPNFSGDGSSGTNANATQHSDVTSPLTGDKAVPSRAIMSPSSTDITPQFPIAKRRHTMLGSNKIHDTYTKALASDAINEVHPERLQFMQDSSQESMQQAKDLMLLKLGFNADAPGISVSDLRKRFERGSISTPPSQPRVRRSSLGVTSPLLDGGINAFSEQQEGFNGVFQNSQMSADDSNSDQMQAAGGPHRRESQVAQLQQKFGGAGRIQIPKRVSSTRRASLGSVASVREMQIAVNRRSLKNISLSDASPTTPPPAVAVPTVESPSPVEKETAVNTAINTSVTPSSSTSETTGLVQESRASTMSKLFGSTHDTDECEDDSKSSANAHPVNQSTNINSIETKSVRFASSSSSSEMKVSDDNNDAPSFSDENPSDNQPSNQQNNPDEDEDGENAPKSEVENILFTQTEILALRLMFSLYDRSGSDTIEYEDLVAYAEETGDTAGIRDAGIALNIIDIDGDGKIGLLDFFHFAARLKAAQQQKGK